MISVGNWASHTQSILGLVLLGEIDAGSLNPVELMSPYDGALKTLQEGADPQDIISVIGASQYKTVLEAGQAVQGVKADWARILTRSASNYKLGQQMHKLGARMMQGEEPSDEVLSQILSGKATDTIDFLPASEIVPELEPLEKIGWQPLDEHAGGLPKIGMTLIAADTGSGKTFLLLRLAEAYARSGRRMVIFTLELPPEILVGRLHQMKLSKKLLKNIWISGSALTVAEVSSIASRAKDAGADAFGVDFAEQLLFGDAAESQMTAIYLSLHRTAYRLRVPAIALAQFRKAGSAPIPTLQEVRYSGMGPGYSRMVFLGHNPSQAFIGREDSKMLPYEEGVAYLIHAKSTYEFVHGGTGAIKIRWNNREDHGKPGWGDSTVEPHWIPMSAV